MPQGTQGNLLTGLLPWVLVIAVFYFMLIMPEKKRQKKMKDMISSLRVGDRVMTKGGIVGTLTAVNDDSLIMETGPARMRIEIVKAAVGQVLESKSAIKEEVKEEVKEEK